MMQRPCKFCDNGQEVMMETSAEGKWIVTNLDGTAHKHVKSSQSTSKPTVTATTTTHEYPSGQTGQEIRSAAIQAAHVENIEASKNLTEAIKELKTAILMLVEAIKAKADGGDLVNGRL